jgi:hypothetical protein
MKTQKYYTLVGQYDDNLDEPSQWGIIFGDYDREVVEQEKEDNKNLNSDFGAKKFKIITTSDKQADIEFAVKRLNANKLVSANEELLLSESFHKVKIKLSGKRPTSYLVVRVDECKNWSGANNGATCYIYTKWSQWADGSVYAPRKQSRKIFDSIDKAFKAGGIGKTTSFYNYREAPSAGCEKKILSQGWGSDLYSPQPIAF